MERENCAEAVEALKEFKQDEMAGQEGSQYKPHAGFRSKQNRLRYDT